MDTNPLSTVKEPQIKESYLKFGDNLIDKVKLPKGDPNKIPLEEFLKEATYLALNCGFDTITPKPLPTKPSVLFDFDGLNKDEQKKIAKEVFGDDLVKEFFDQRWKILIKNLNNKKWLEKLLGRLESYGDTLNAAKVRQRFQDFEEWIQENRAIIDYYFKKKSKRHLTPS